MSTGMGEMDPRLVALVGELMGHVPGGTPLPPPPTAPAPDQTPAEWLDDVEQIRQQHDAVADILAVHLTPPGPAVQSVRDHPIDVDGASITARVYTPLSAGPHPAIVFYHGGAWWLAGGEKGFALTDDYCRTFCGGLSAVVINVDYRLAPEAAFPAQLNDSFAGLRWVSDNAAELNIDPTRISVMGASSGGNQAAAVCLLARDRGAPSIKAQILHVPVLDLTGGSPSLNSDPGWPALSDIIGLYATQQQRLDPLASPLLASELSALPPAVIVTGLYDSLRDDGRRYAQRLADDAVPVRHFEYPMLHNIALLETTKAMFADMIQAIRDVY